MDILCFLYCYGCILATVSDRVLYLPGENLIRLLVGSSCSFGCFPVWRSICIWPGVGRRNLNCSRFVSVPCPSKIFIFANTRKYFPETNKKGGASPLMDDAPSLLYPYSFSFSFFFSSCSFFHWANSRWLSAPSWKGVISGRRYLLQREGGPGLFGMDEFLNKLYFSPVQIWEHRIFCFQGAL